MLLYPSIDPRLARGADGVVFLVRMDILVFLGGEDNRVVALALEIVEFNLLLLAIF